MRFLSFKLFNKDPLRKKDTIISFFVKIEDEIYNTMLSSNHDVKHNKYVLEYWKNKIFSIVVVFLIAFGSPLLLFGAFMFHSLGNNAAAIFELSIAIIIPVIITKKSLSVTFRKVFSISILYFTSILLLINTGVMGAGMVCVAFPLILAGCLLEKKHAYRFVIINVIVFTLITALLMNGYFDSTPMESYKNVWFINAITTQICGILLLILMNIISQGLERQTRIIKDSRDLLIASDTKHKAMIANIADVIAISDENGFIQYISPNLEKRFGWKVDELLNKHILEKAHAEDRDIIEKEYKALLKKDGAEKTMQVRCLTKNNDIKHIELTGINLTKDHDIKGVLINFHDITEGKIREEKILYLNHHDGLTGLYNRTFFEQEIIHFDTESRLPLSIIIGDINGLKIINDSLGHAEGDKLIVAMAKILESCCDKEHIVARLGGDEFGIILPKTSNDAVAEIIKKINLSCEEYNKKVSSESLYTSIALGYATKATIDESFEDIKKNAEEYMYKRKLLENRSLHSVLIASMKTALHEKSQETEEHAQRLVMLSKEIGQKFGLTDEQFNDLELLASLHDIGKIGVDDQILNKPGKLTDEEWVEMKKHSEIGYRIAMSSPKLMSIAEYILTHHERFDGKGYPQGLCGENIPLLSRIVAVVDAYDAMTEDRPYRKGMSKEAAVAEIIKNSGTQFDPSIAKIFIEILSDR